MEWVGSIKDWGEEDDTGKNCQWLNILKEMQKNFFFKPLAIQRSKIGS